MNEKQLQQNYIYHLDILKNKILKKKYDLKEKNISSLTGASSRIVFLAHLGLIENKQAEYEKLILDDINEIISFIEKNETSPLNFDGLSGFGSTVNMIKKMGYFNHTEDTLIELDDFIILSAKISFNENNFDLFYGGIGHINYLLDRVRNNNKIEISIRDILNTNFFIRIYKRDFSFLYNKIENSIDFSLAHGLSSIIVSLCKIINANIEVDRCIYLLNNCCDLVLSKLSLTNEGYRIPDYLINNNPKYSPLRWCHGELGILTALNMASKIVNNEKLNYYIPQVLNTISKFKLTKQQELVSPNICHGTLGVAHIMNRLSKSFSTNEILEAKLYWYKESDKLMRSNIGYKDNDDIGEFIEKDGILMGIEGIGLAVISFLYPDHSNWDHQILLS